MQITEATQITEADGERIRTRPRSLKAPYDAEALRGLEQMLDAGDATLEALPESWAYTHRLETHLGARWLVFIRETTESEQS